jgi:hypothetical protein
MLEAVAAEVRKRQAETPAAPLPPPPALPPVAEAPIPAAGDDSLVSEAKAMLARLQAPARQNSDPILAQVDALLAVLDQEQAEIIAARTAERRLREDLARVNNENSQLRDLVKSLIQAIEDDQRRQAGVLDALDQRVNAANRRPRI